MTFDDEFIQEAVSAALRFFAERGAASLPEEFDERRKAAMTSAAPAEAVLKIHRHYFDVLGIAGGFEAIMKEFPLLENGGIPILIKRAFGRHLEGPRMEATGGQKVLTVSIQTCRLLNHGLFQIFLRCCFLKASDMVDPEFGYPSLLDPDRADLERNDRLRERFNDLWDRSIAARLGCEAHRVTPEKGASFVIFSSSENKSGTPGDKATHHTLVSMAREELCRERSR